MDGGGGGAGARSRRRAAAAEGVAAWRSRRALEARAAEGHRQGLPLHCLGIPIVAFFRNSGQNRSLCRRPFRTACDGGGRSFLRSL